MKNHTIIIVLILAGFQLSGLAQACEGGAINTKESYLYGRFEVAMQSAPGSGIVSSFFLYNIEVGCNWPAQNNEIDIEMTGITDSVFFTTHHPGAWHWGEAFQFDFSPHETIMEYAIEWEPESIRWFVGDQLVYEQDETLAGDLSYPMAILMNLWAAEASSWAGAWNPAILPQQALYDYVRYYSYTPGQGHAGTNNNFQFEWEDDFNTYDAARWDISDFDGFIGNYCTFRSRQVEFSNGYMRLSIDEPLPDPEIIPVSFSVNMVEETLAPNDIIYLNGTFNDWCGTCDPMIKNGNIWSLTRELTPGKYEYLFTKNGWEEIGNAPPGSECDLFPCDTYANYGFVVSPDAGEVVLDTYCWRTCQNCPTQGVSDPDLGTNKKLLKVVDLWGRNAPPNGQQLLFYIYDDGSVEKRLNVDLRVE